MPELDYAAKEARLRFAIVGPPGAGRTSTLRRLHADLPLLERTEISDVALKSGRLLSFDFAPGELLPLAEYRARATLLTFTAPLAEVAAYTRVCADLDALVFVADSRRSKSDTNLATLRHLGALRFLADVPVVFFYNQRDGADALPVADLEAQLNPLRAPHRAGVATTGEGMDGLLAELVRAIMDSSV
jgi:mutual gliding-motility protein MglA